MTNVQPDDYRALYDLLGGYFNQDYEDLYGDYEGAVRTAYAESGPDYRREVVADIDRLLGLRLDDESLRAAVARLGCALSLKGWTTPRRFLEALRCAMTGAMPKPAQST